MTNYLSDRIVANRLSISEIAEITGHSEFDIGRAVGILKQGNLVRV